MQFSQQFIEWCVVRVNFNTFFALLNRQVQLGCPLPNQRQLEVNLRVFRVDTQRVFIRTDGTTRVTFCQFSIAHFEVNGCKTWFNVTRSWVPNVSLFDIFLRAVHVRITDKHHYIRVTFSVGLRSWTANRLVKSFHRLRCVFLVEQQFAHTDKALRIVFCQHQTFVVLLAGFVHRIIRFIVD